MPTSLAVVQIRAVESLADHRACACLQREIWGAEFDEVVPASLMLAAGHVGALTIGAFGPDGTLLGFVFGLTGVKNGELVHWSHMLGVRPDARDRGVGRRLKEFQRAALAERGIGLMYWTFDPLQARNAHLNINRLGARVIEYVADMYGASQSPLHHDLATDRLVVECPTLADADRLANGTPGRCLEDPVFTPFPQTGDAMPAEATPPRALLEVPWDLQDVVADSITVALQWRQATRQHFQWALEHGYGITCLHRDSAARRVFFVIERASDAKAAHTRASS